MRARSRAAACALSYPSTRICSTRPRGGPRLNSTARALKARLGELADETIGAVPARERRDLNRVAAVVGAHGHRRRRRRRDFAGDRSARAAVMACADVHCGRAGNVGRVDVDRLRLVVQEASRDARGDCERQDQQRDGEPVRARATQRAREVGFRRELGQNLRRARRGVSPASADRLDDLDGRRSVGRRRLLHLRRAIRRESPLLPRPVPRCRVT